MKENDVAAFAYLALAGDLSGEGNTFDHHLACFHGRHIPGMVSECDELPYHGKYSGSVGGIESTVVESCSVYLDTANGTRTVLQGTAQPSGESSKGACSFSFVHKHECRYGFRHQQGVPTVQQFVPPVLERDSCFLQCHPESSQPR